MPHAQCIRALKRLSANVCRNLLDNIFTLVNILSSRFLQTLADKCARQYINFRNLILVKVKVTLLLKCE